MTDMTEFLAARLDETEARPKAAAELCGCHPAAPRWVLSDDDDGGRIRAADGSHPELRRTLGHRWNRTYTDLYAARHIALHDPARALRAVEANRKILAEYERLNAAYLAFHHGANQAALLAIETAVLLLISVYADHPDYRQEWAS